jgi:hypothetical protein
MSTRKEPSVGLYSRVELEIKAKAAVLALIRCIDTDGLVAQICSSYVDFCKRPEAKSFTIKYRKTTEGVPLRVFFEIICFAAFLTTMETRNYVTIKKLFRKTIDRDSEDYFNGRLAIQLREQCQKMGMSRFDEIVLLSPPSDIKIRFGDPLDPMRRLAEYSACHEREPEATKQQFSIYLGKVFDPVNYYAFEGLWEAYEKVLVSIAEKVMAGVFKPPVRLNSCCTC